MASSLHPLFFDFELFILQPMIQSSKFTVIHLVQICHKVLVYDWCHLLLLLSGGHFYDFLLHAWHVLEFRDNIFISLLESFTLLSKVLILIHENLVIMRDLIYHLITGLCNELKINQFLVSLFQELLDVHNGLVSGLDGYVSSMS